jgi:thiol-disulfide isomerase/thioredoxin
MNTSAPKAWARLELRATKTEPNALGATVVVRADGRSQLDRVRLTAGFHTQVSPEMHFGLGSATTFDVELRWPSGQVERHVGLASKTRYRVTQGSPPVARPLRTWPEANRPVVGRRFDVGVDTTTLDGAPGKLPARGPLLVNFWAPWCEGCDREMPALAELAGRGKLAVVGVSAETKDIPSVRAFLKRHGVDYPQRLATSALVESFFGPGGEMTLPASFLFDAGLELRRSWFRQVDVAEIEAAVANAGVSAEDYMSQAEMFRADGDPVSALQAMREAARLVPDAPMTRLNLAVVALSARQYEEAEAAARHVVEAAPNERLGWEILVLALERSDRSAAAHAMVRKGLKHLPDDPFLRERTPR